MAFDLKNRRMSTGMALINCPECNNRVSDSASVCPHCGYDIAGHFRRIEAHRKNLAEARRRMYFWFAIKSTRSTGHNNFITGQPIYDNYTETFKTYTAAEAAVKYGGDVEEAPQGKYYTENGWLADIPSELKDAEYYEAEKHREEERELRRKKDAAAEKRRQEECAANLSITEAIVRIYGIKETTVTKYNGQGGSVTIPEGITSIGERAFFGCTVLTNITIPVSVTNVEKEAFWGCTGLASVTFAGGNTKAGYSYETTEQGYDTDDEGLQIVYKTQSHDVIAFDGEGIPIHPQAGTYKKSESRWYRERGLTREDFERLLQKPAAKKSCFITTAVCGSFGKSDDCRELTAFRAFRDNWLIKQPDGQALITEYYCIAPGIVAAIDASGNQNAVYRSIWDTYLVECLRSIEVGDFTTCKGVYIKMVEELRRIFSNDKY
jgi:hypothetical protein